MMRNVNPLGLIVCGVCVAVSLAFAVKYGMSLSPDPFESLIYSSIGVAAVVWEVVGWHRATHLYRVGRSWAAGLCVVGLMLSTVITIQYELGFLANLFEAKASIGESSASARASMEAERANLQAQIARAGIVRPAEAVRGELSGMRALQSQADRAKADGDAEAADKGCGERCRAHRSVYTALSAKLAASPIDKLQAELGIAEGVERAQDRIRKITAELQPLAAAGVADARANYMHLVFGVSETGARLTLSLLIILFLLAGRSWSPFTFMDPPAPADMSINKGAMRQADAALGRRPAAELFPPADAIEASGPPEDADFIESDMGTEDAESAEEPPFDPEDLEMLRAFESSPPAQASHDPEPIEVEPEPKSLTPSQERTRALVRNFIVDYCMVHPDDHSQREPAATMQSAFKQWQADKEIEDSVNSNDFGDALTAILGDLGGGKIHSNGKKYVGIRLKPYATHRLSLAGEQRAEPRDASALGANGRERRAAIAAGSLDGIPHGNA